MHTTKGVFKSIRRVLFFPLPLLFSYCSPLGDPVNPEVSQNHYYNKKKTKVIYSSQGNWYGQGKTEMKVDILSFQVLSPYISKDRNQIYVYTAPVTIEEMNIEAFYVKPGNTNHFVGFDDKYVYEFPATILKDSSYQNIAKVIKGADPSTYEYYDSDWAKDHQNYYYRNQRVDVDYATFKNLNKNYSVDGQKAYAHINGNFHILETAQRSSFKILENSNYAYDENTIYFLNFPFDERPQAWEEIQVESTDSIELMTEFYLKCSDLVLFGGQPLPKVKAGKFELIGSSYGKDGQRVYYGAEVLPNADLNTFKLTEDGYAVQDKNGVYHNGVLQTNETPK